MLKTCLSNQYIVSFSQMTLSLHLLGGPRNFWKWDRNFVKRIPRRVSQGKCN